MGDKSRHCFAPAYTMSQEQFSNIFRKGVAMKDGDDMKCGICGGDIPPGDGICETGNEADAEVIASYSEACEKADEEDAREGVYTNFVIDAECKDSISASRLREVLTEAALASGCLENTVVGVQMITPLEEARIGG